MSYYPKEVAPEVVPIAKRDQIGQLNTRESLNPLEVKIRLAETRMTLAVRRMEARTPPPTHPTYIGMIELRLNTLARPYGLRQKFSRESTRPSWPASTTR